jgi:hypothetical protein
MSPFSPFTRRSFTHVHPSSAIALPPGVNLPLPENEGERKINDLPSLSALAEVSLYIRPCLYTDQGQEQQDNENKWNDNGLRDMS